MAPEMFEERPQTVTVDVWAAIRSSTQALAQHRIRGQPLESEVVLQCITESLQHR